MRRAVCVLLTALAGCSSGTCRGSADPPPPAPTQAASAPAAQIPDADALLMGRLEALRTGGRTLEVVPPDEDEERAFEAWIEALARAAAAARPPPGAAPPGFALEEIADRGLWLVHEQDGPPAAGGSARTSRVARQPSRRGAGAIVLRTGPAAAVLVEAPHTFFDRGTLPLAAAIFEARRARALLINTAHRYGGRPPPSNDDPARQPPPASDVAHAERSFFLAAHRALIRAIPGAPTVQLHGYQDSSAPGVAAIVSAAGGRADLGALLAPLRAALPGEVIHAYPADIQKLGGESNAQAHASKAAAAPFYHLEMSRSLRDRLVEDATLRRRFAAAFSVLGQGSPEPR